MCKYSNTGHGRQVILAGQYKVIWHHICYGYSLSDQPVKALQQVSAALVSIWVWHNTTSPFLYEL